MDSCGILTAGQGFDNVISEDDLVKPNGCINWSYAPINFKEDFIESFKEAIDMVFEIGEITGNEIEIGINILIILDKIGVLINTKNLPNEKFEYVYNEMQIK